MSLSAVPDGEFTLAELVNDSTITALGWSVDAACADLVAGL
jgi:hypothetical protein